MKVPIQAASRLRVVAKASQAQTRKYLVSLGLSPLGGKAPVNQTGNIWMYLKDDGADAVDAVQQHLGQPKFSKQGQVKRYTFKAGAGRSVVVCAGPGIAWVILTDSEDLPTPEEMQQMSKSGPKMSRRLK